MWSFLGAVGATIAFAAGTTITTNCTLHGTQACVLYPNGSATVVNSSSNGLLDLHKRQIRIIESLPQVSVVDASGNQIESIYPMQNSTIEIFNLSSNRIEAIDSLSNLQALRELDVSFNSIREFPTDLLNRSFAQLTSLNLSGNQITTIQLLALPSQLTSLDLSQNALTAFDMTDQVFNALVSMPHLVLGAMPLSQCNHGTTRYLRNVKVCILDASSPSIAFLSTSYGILTLIVCVIAAGVLIFILVKRRYCRRTPPSVMMYRDTRLSSNYSCVEDNPVEYRISLSIDMDTSRFLHTLETEVPQYKLAMKNLKKLKLVSTPRTYTNYVASYLNDRVDCKVLTPCSSSEETLGNIAGLVNEITMLSQLNHPNIILLVGYATSSTLLDLVLVTELMTYGTVLTVFRDPELNKYLHWKSGNAIVASKTQMALDIATAVAYLHGLETPVIHNAISLENAWISSKWQVKLAGFMHSTFLENGSTDSNAVPEMTRSQRATTKADVYLLGRFFQDLDFSLAGETSDAMPTYMRELITSCLQPNPNDRPTSSDIVQLLSKEISS